MDAEKAKKLQQYAVVLNEQAMEEEKTGKSEEAIKHYLKLVDVFLVLAAEAPDHNTWLQYIRQAEAYQTRTRSIMPKEGVASPKQVSSPPTVPNLLQRSESTPVKQNPLKKMLRPFQKADGETLDAESITSRAQKVSTLPTTSSQHVRSLSTPAESTVSSEIYQRVVSENKLIRDKISALAKENEERIIALEKENRELQSKISEMVPRTDYDTMEAEIANMVPRSEYDRVRAELLNTVPKEHYDDLLDRLADMVPRQTYLDAERRVLELENAVKNSVPSKTIDDLASEVSLLGVLSEVPLEHVAIPKEEKTENQVATEIVLPE